MCKRHCIQKYQIYHMSLITVRYKISQENTAHRYHILSLKDLYHCIISYDQFILRHNRRVGRAEYIHFCFIDIILRCIVLTRYFAYFLHILPLLVVVNACKIDVSRNSPIFSQLNLILNSYILLCI